jgi:hypothetical protein
MRTTSHPHPSDVSHPRRSSLRLACALSLLCALTSCEAYDPPPEVTLLQPAEGSFFSGDPITLQFSKAIDPASLQVRIWSNTFDDENRLITTSPPLLDTCTPQTSPCGNNALTVAPDNLSAQLALDPDTLGKPDIPLVLQVTESLRDPAGNQRGVDAEFSFVFKPRPDPDACDPIVAFESGAYALIGSTTEPVPVTLRLISTVTAQPNGEFVIAGAQARLKDGAPDASTDPADMNIDDTSSGFTIFVRGRICGRDGVRFIETDPFVVQLSLATIGIEMRGTRLTGQVVTDPDTGKDRLDTLLSYTNLTLTLGKRPTEYDAGNAPILGDWIDTPSIPPGTPNACDDICGAVAPLGTCEPPADFPGEGFCAAP